MESVNSFLNQFSWDELNEITDQFSMANFIGESADYKFFRGIVSQPSQMHVTVKVWKDSVTFQDKLRRLKGESRFFTPPEAIKCSNVVNVIGFCCDGEHIGVVYNLNSVSTLENYLAQGVDKFQWRERMIVALGIARLFCFLQHFESTHSIHWALPSCVILDQEMNPVLCDIGLLTSGASQLIEGPGDSCSLRKPSSSDDARSKTFGMFSFGMLLLRIICREDVVKLEEYNYFFISSPHFPETVCEPYRKMERQRFFYKYDYHEVTSIAERCVVKKGWRWNVPCFEDDEITITEVVQRLDGLLLFSLPVGKPREKVDTRGCTLMYFSYENLCEMTDNFSKQNLFAPTQLGEAYRGKIPQDWTGMESQNVIVKVWGRVNCKTFGREVMKSSMEDNICRLRDEVFLLTRGEVYDHPNRVKLVGYCFDDKKVGAVYCHDPLDTLQNLLGDDDKLSWRDRVMIGLELARFLELLHGQEPQYVVRNICAAHVLIDHDKKPFLYDFSMLKGEIFPGKKAAGNYKLRGFVDYSEPCHLRTGLIVPQLDIFAFGVLLMSLICKCEMGEKIGDLICTFVEEDCKSKISIAANESFVNHASFDQYDSHKLSVLAMQCVGLVHWATRPTASDIVKQLSHLLLFPGTHVSADFDVDVDVDNDVEAIRKPPSQTKYRHIFEKLMPCAAGKRKEENQREAVRPQVNRSRVLKTRGRIPELQHPGFADDARLEEMGKTMNGRDVNDMNHQSSVVHRQPLVAT